MLIPDNMISEFGLTKLDRLIRKEYPPAPGWLPVETYDMVQCGYPSPNHGEMVIRPDGGTNKKGELLPPGGMWCKAEDVRKLLKKMETTWKAAT